MDFLIAIWNKLNKPFHFLVIGGAVAYFAPLEYQWIGYVSFSFGLIGVLGDYFIQPLHRKTKQYLKVRKNIDTLNHNEEQILFRQLLKGEKTFYASVAERISLSDHFARGNVYIGLQNKGFLTIHGNGANMILHINDYAWNALLKRQENLLAYDMEDLSDSARETNNG